jgi:alanyl-tRNA synthetase
VTSQVNEVLLRSLAPSVLGILVDGRPADRATQGQIAEVILAETALYAESGGQVADKGVIIGPGFELEVLDVQKPVAGLVSHTVEVTSGEVGVGQPATSVVDAANRRAARQAHSATHLVHSALRDTLGRTATQAGSLNRAGYMRFDFTWGQSLSDSTKSEIEDIANSAVRDNLEVTTRVLSLDEAKNLGAMALFGEKYGDTVRMVDIGGPWSRELCAGTHVSSSAEIGLINLVGESSVGASNRRVEALVGADAFRSLAAERALVSQLTTTLKTPRDQLPARIAELTASLKAAEKKIAALESKALGDRLPALGDGGPDRDLRGYRPRSASARQPQHDDLAGQFARGRHVGVGGTWAHRADRLEVRVMGIDDAHDIDVVEDDDAIALGLAQQITGQRVLADDNGRADVLPPVDDVGRLQPFAVQPAHVERQQLLQLIGRQA